MTPAWAGTTMRFTPTGCSAREDPSVSRAAQPYKIVNSAASPSRRYEVTCRTVYSATWDGYDVCVANSSVDVSILACLAAAFDAGAVLVEPRDLMRRADRFSSRRELRTGGDVSASSGSDPGRRRRRPGCGGHGPHRGWLAPRHMLGSGSGWCARLRGGVCLWSEGQFAS